MLVWKTWSSEIQFDFEFRKAMNILKALFKILERQSLPSVPQKQPNQVS